VGNQKLHAEANFSETKVEIPDERFLFSSIFKFWSWKNYKAE